MNNKTRKITGFVLFVLFISIFCWLFYNILFSKSDVQNELQEHSTQWLDAVMRGNMTSALKMVNIICPDFPNSTPLKQVIELFEKNGISAKFINAGYNKWDFIYWRNSLFFSGLAKSLTESARDKDNASEQLILLLNAVHNRVKPVSIPKDIIPWPYTVWHLKKGLCDRQTGLAFFRTSLSTWV